MSELWSVLGIVVSVGLFLIGYRQTVGARKERVTNANQEVEKILVRRIVLEGGAWALAVLTGGLAWLLIEYGRDRRRALRIRLRQLRQIDGGGG